MSVGESAGRTAGSLLPYGWPSLSLTRSRAVFVSSVFVSACPFPGASGRSVDQGIVCYPHGRLPPSPQRPVMIARLAHAGRQPATTGHSLTGPATMAPGTHLGPPVRNVSPAANEHDRAGQTGKSSMTSLYRFWPPAKAR